MYPLMATYITTQHEYAAGRPTPPLPAEGEPPKAGESLSPSAISRAT